MIIDINKEREKFEKVARTQGLDRFCLSMEPCFKGQYADSRTQIAWRLWLAAKVDADAEQKVGDPSNNSLEGAERKAP